MNQSHCPSCNAARDADDNFCRRCGRQITIDLPAVRESHLPVEAGSSALAPSIVGSVAVLAAGTALEWLARRIAGGAARGAARAAGRALTRREASALMPAPKDEPAVKVREFFYVREVDLRR